MMDSFSNEDEQSYFFDALEQIAPEPGLGSECIYMKNSEYDVWTRTPRSVTERRSKFISQLGFTDNDSSARACGDSSNGYDDVSRDSNRIMENRGAVLRNSCNDDKCFSSSSSVSSWSTEDSELSQDVGFCECRIENKNSNIGREVLVNVSQCSCGADEEINCNSPRTMDKLKDKSLSKLRNMTCMISRNVKDDSAELFDSFDHQVEVTKMKRVKVRHHSKKSKELSGLFTGQNIQAHEGSILIMRFSPDGQYLASAGEDKIVKVWQVVEDERSDIVDVPDADPSCAYFSVNRFSGLRPLMLEKDKTNKFKNMMRTPDSACVIFPPKVFRILEKPLHVFQEHTGQILDLSWSKKNLLLSSSVDKTVRLWRVGSDQCLKIFSHTDYVTCIQFNPVNDDFFISGSIDGKVRVWKISGCHVVEWTETRDIITAISYRPDGQGGIIGFITGTCCFFNISDNHIQLESQMCLASKKKGPCKRITGFQFLPQDPSKVMVTCADSQVKVINGTDVIAKYKGFRNAGNNFSASFTSDGKHIVSASEDSNIYLWNYADRVEPSILPKKSIRSFECFPSDASVAITWSGLKNGDTDNNLRSRKSHASSISSLPFSSPEYLLESNTKFSATWPAEKLPSIASPQTKTSQIGKSHYKLFKNCCQSLSDRHLWGLVIVTAGWDGWIRSFHSYGLPAPL